jgi:hypothetical protein
MNLWGIGFPYSISRFSLNGGYAKLHQKLFFFFYSYTSCTVLYDFFMLVVVLKQTVSPQSPMINKLFHSHIYTGYTQKNGVVSKVNKKFISHLTRAQHTP